MKRIYLESLTIRNFKGIQNFEFNPGKGENFIHGANGTGKTTVFDAFSWLMFGKNSENQSVFEIKTIDKKTGKVIHKLSHEVKANISFDGRSVELQKTLSEKWTKKRGSAIEELTGHETEYLIDGVPKKQGEFKAMIDLIIQESISRIITDPMYFNAVLPWKERREILFKLAEIKEDKELVFLHPEESVVSIVNQILISGKTIEDQKKVIANEKKRLNEKIEEIPSRIDELQRMKTTFTDEELVQSEGAEKKINDLEEERVSIRKGINSNPIDLSKENEELVKLNGELQQLQNKKNEIVRNENQKRSEYIDSKNILEIELNSLKKRIETASGLIESKKERIDFLKSKKAELKKEYNAEKEKTFTFDQSLCVCPSCLREYDQDKIQQTQEEKLESFRKIQSQTIERLKSEAVSINSDIESEEKSIQEHEEIVSKSKSRLQEVEETLETLIEPIQIQIDFDAIPEISILNQSILQVKDSISKAEESKREKINSLNATSKEQETQIEEKSREISLQIAVLQKLVSAKEQNALIQSRINDLEEQLKTLNQEKANLEKQEFAIENFNKWKIEKVESLINNSFEFVNFKMFEEQLNGGFSETCVCTIDGVSFNDLNTASKYKAGLDVIKTLQKYFGISAPIFIDGRESITKIQEMDSQIINLIVDPSSKQLETKTL